MIVVLDMTNELPSFGEIKFIVQVSGIVYFIINKSNTSNFNDRVQAYVVENSEIFQFIEHKNLATYMVFRIVGQRK